MANKQFNPPTVQRPGGPYSHSVEVAPGARWLCVAGQTGTRPDGSVPDGIEAQAEAAWTNLINVLEGSGYRLEDVVKIQTFLTRREDREGYNKVRTRFIGAHRPASTFLIVAGLADPRYLVEIEAMAAKG
jgi:enamine deaminase RidA (YjgF/YER057c/UK114 family)